MKFIDCQAFLIELQFLKLNYFLFSAELFLFNFPQQRNKINKGNWTAQFCWCKYHEEPKYTNCTIKFVFCFFFIFFHFFSHRLVCAKQTRRTVLETFNSSKYLFLKITETRNFPVKSTSVLKMRFLSLNFKIKIKTTWNGFSLIYEMKVFSPRNI